MCSCPWKRSSNSWFMRTELRIVYVRSISNLPNSCKTKPSCNADCQTAKFNSPPAFKLYGSTVQSEPLCPQTDRCHTRQVKCLHFLPGLWYLAYKRYLYCMIMASRIQKSTLVSNFGQGKFVEPVAHHSTYRRNWLLSACAYNTRQQENMRLTKSMCLTGSMRLIKSAKTR